MAMPDVQYPINTYGGLKKAVSLWIDRDDEEFINQIPNFINFAEKEIYRNLRIPAMEKEAYLEIREGVAFIPIDLLEIKYILASKTGKVFRVTSPEELDLLKNTQSRSAPTNEIVFTRLGGRLYFYPEITADIPKSTSAPSDIPSNAVIINYYEDSKEMIKDDDTNVLLTIAPELLLYYTLRHASLFVQDDEGAQKWSVIGKAALDEIVTQAEKMEYSGSPLVVSNYHQGLGFMSHYGNKRFY